VCIADDAQWCQSIQDDAGAETPILNWSEFEQNPPSHSQSVAVVLLCAELRIVDRRLGHLCRTFPAGVVVEVLDSPDCTDKLFFAHGYRKISPRGKATLPRADEITSPSVRRYEYRLCDYKPAPEWLNARFWAHPERFLL